jgi:cytoskeletal protein CcmA (bactofilin family)
MSGRANVPAGQTVGNLVVFHGSAVVDGTVDGSLTAFDAPVTISGRVNGDVTAFNGRVELRQGAHVTGDVVTRNAPVVAQGAVIDGATRRVETNFNFEGFGWIGRLAWWLAVSISTLALGLLLIGLAGRGAPKLADTARSALGLSIGWGLLLFFGLPILALVALATVVGIPFGIGLLAALGLIYGLGYAASAWVLGRTLLREPASWVLAFLAGWGILRVVALIPFFGGMVWTLAVIFGLGALTVAVWRARSAGQQAVQPA